MTSPLVTAAAALLGEYLVLEELSTPELVLAHCDRCGHVRLPGAPICPECLAHGAHDEADEGRGSIWSFCVYHRAFDAVFTAALPYNVALIELDAGPRLISNVLDADPGDLAVGARVVARVEEVLPGRHLVYFGLDGERGST